MAESYTVEIKDSDDKTTGISKLNKSDILLNIGNCYVDREYRFYTILSPVKVSQPFSYPRLFYIMYVFCAVTLVMGIYTVLNGFRWSILLLCISDLVYLVMVPCIMTETSDFSYYGHRLEIYDPQLKRILGQVLFALWILFNLVSVSFMLWLIKYLFC